MEAHSHMDELARTPASAAAVLVAAERIAVEAERRRSAMRRRGARHTNCWVGVARAVGCRRRRVFVVVTEKEVDTGLKRVVVAASGMLALAVLVSPAAPVAAAADTHLPLSPQRRFRVDQERYQRCLV